MKKIYKFPELPIFYYLAEEGTTFKILIANRGRVVTRFNVCLITFPMKPNLVNINCYYGRVSLTQTQINSMER